MSSPLLPDTSRSCHVHVRLDCHVRTLEHNIRTYDTVQCVVHRHPAMFTSHSSVQWVSQYWYTHAPMYSRAVKRAGPHCQHGMHAQHKRGPRMCRWCVHGQRRQERIIHNSWQQRFQLLSGLLQAAAAAVTCAKWCRVEHPSYTRVTIVEKRVSNFQIVLLCIHA